MRNLDFLQHMDVSSDLITLYIVYASVSMLYILLKLATIIGSSFTELWNYIHLMNNTSELTQMITNVDAKLVDLRNIVFVNAYCSSDIVGNMLPSTHELHELTDEFDALTDLMKIDVNWNGLVPETIKNYFINTSTVNHDTLVLKFVQLREHNEAIINSLIHFNSSVSDSYISRYPDPDEIREIKVFIEAFLKAVERYDIQLNKLVLMFPLRQ